MSIIKENDPSDGFMRCIETLKNKHCIEAPSRFRNCGSLNVCPFSVLFFRKMLYDPFNTFDKFHEIEHSCFTRQLDPSPSLILFCE